jgi:dTDP-4-dehydrorhamnose reductase
MSMLLTGGRGRLGQELQKHLSVLAPSSQEFDITDLASMRDYVDKHTPNLLIHAAAYTNVSGAEKDKQACWNVNVEGTRNIVKLALEHSLPLVHISTDYVFWGDLGGYKEDNPLGPVRNYYALSKLVAEELVRVVPKHLVIRTSFRPVEWPYQTAFDDIYTSQDYVDVIGPDIALAIKHYPEIQYNTLHIATERKSVYDLASRRKPDVQRGSKANANVSLPDDISLDISRWHAVQAELGRRKEEGGRRKE